MFTSEELRKKVLKMNKKQLIELLINHYEILLKFNKCNCKMENK
ncbi:hypothetical protein [Spiroplasma endosymbiont of Cleonymus obscurus]